MNAWADFTLVVPTYDRTAELGRLLRYLARHQMACPVVVLDSSHAGPRAANRAAVAEVDLDVRVLEFEPAMDPFEKFWRGVEQVATGACALCADDDLVLVDALAELIDVLARQRDCDAVHGQYFNFVPGERFRVGPLVFAGSSIAAATPRRRLWELMQQYHPLTYAVCRTEALRRALGAVQALSSPMARELVGGALIAIGGKVERRPGLYYGRAEGSTLGYERWHPIEYLARSPEDMLDEHGRSRQILAKAIQEVDAAPDDSTDLVKLIDLVFVRYLAGYASPEALDTLIAGVLAGHDPREAFERARPLLVPHGGTLADSVRRSARLRRLRDRFAPNLRLRDLSGLLGGNGDRVEHRRTPGGRARRYVLYRDVLQGLAVSAPAATSLPALLDALDRYE